MVFTATIAHAADPLPSWNDGASKKSIVEFVTKVTKPAEREAYDRTDSLARLEKGLDEAAQRGWTVVDMKKDGKTIYPPAQK